MPPTFPAGSYPARVVADGASYYWRLGEPSGTTAVDSVGGATGTISGGVTLAQPGALSDGDKAMTFDGATGKVVTATPITVSDVATVEAWIKTTVRAAMNQPIIGNRGGGNTGGVIFVHATLQSTTVVVGTVTNVFAYGTREVADGAWHYVALVLDGAADFVTIYVDGTLDRVVAGETRLAGTGLATIGWDPVAAVFFPGALDEVAVYPRALTAPEIAAHYTLGKQARREQLIVASLWPGQWAGRL